MYIDFYKKRLYSAETLDISIVDVTTFC